MAAVDHIALDGIPFVHRTRFHLLKAKAEMQSRSAKRTRVLIVSHPAVLPVNQLAYAALRKKGYEVDLIVPSRWRHEYAPRPFRSVALPELAEHFHQRRILFIGKPQRHFYLVNTIAELRRFRPDVLFCECEPFSVSAAEWGLAAAILGIPFGVQLAENLNRRLPWPARVLRRLVLPRAAFVAARSTAATRLAEVWGATGRIRLISHHVPDWPADPRLPNKTFTVGFAGRLVEEKGLDVLAAAVRRLRPGSRLLIAGDGPLLPWLKSVDLGGAELCVLPSVDHMEMAAAYAKMDVLVLPSRTTSNWAEQFGRVLVEAMWCGTPVLGSDSGEIPWVIETTGGGEIFPEGDDRALAASITRLREDVAYRELLGRRGQSQARKLWSVEAVADGFDEIMRHLTLNPRG